MAAGVRLGKFGVQTFAASALPEILKSFDKPWTGTIDDELVAEARRHDVGPLVYHAIALRGGWDRQSSTAHEAFSQMAAEAALFEELNSQQVRRVLAALTGAGLAPLVFKGAALAYRHYPRPWLRPREDTDLIVRQDDVDEAAAIFERLGYSRVPRPTGDLVTHQFAYRTTAQGICHEFDVHWRISDPEVFADVLSFEALDRESVPLPALGPGARAIGDAHALVVACTHRVAHHYDTESLLWLYDIDLLARQLDGRGWTLVTAIAADKQIRQVCSRGLSLSARLFGTPVPAGVCELLARRPDVEPTAAYLRDGLRRVDLLQSDLGALNGWSARAKLLREHLFPPPAYILKSYGQTRGFLLPALYVHRIMRGAVDWLRPLR